MTMDRRFVRTAAVPMNNDEPSSPGQPARDPKSEPKRELLPSATSTAVAEAPSKTPRRISPQHLPQFRVLLHNDDVNEMLFVVGTVMELAALPKERAILVVLEADSTGVALVLVTHKERAELYMDQFTSKGLTVTIEPVE